jgi:hypothetical protein
MLTKGENEYRIETEYSLVKHLKILCDQDEKYKNLYAVWILDQEVYSKALASVSLNFPHYSMHETSHSSNIINKIEMLLGEERIKNLSPTDTFMILESAYLHDFGMIVPDKKLKSEWSKSSFQRFIKLLSESTYDDSIAKAARFLLNISSGEVKLEGNENKCWPIDVKNYVVLIIAEYFRRKHNITSSDWINDPREIGIDINFNKLIPERIMRLIGRISFCHGVDFQTMLSELDYIDNGVGTDRVHPRFIACLLRLGDLLDLDNGRFNPVFEKTTIFPESSISHREKHRSITHFLVCPEKIEVSAICENDKVYRVTREWFDWLREELKNLSSKWSTIVPTNFKGGPPSLGEIKLSIKDSEKITEQLDLRFTIDQRIAFDLIEGSGIYNSELIFIRELVQNAIDATKMQIWKDVKSGKYDFINLLGNRKISSETYNFHDEFPDLLKQFYPISIEITHNSVKTFEADAEYVFKIEDRGCGMSLKDLKRMENVGASWEQDENLAEFIDSMPYWLRPTGSFGIGLHSVFMVTDEIEINSKSENDLAYKINFISRKRNGYITVKEDKYGRKTNGTTITVRISETKLDSIAKKTEPFKSFREIEEREYIDKFKKYDFFNENYDKDMIFSYLAAYINKFIEYLKIVNVNCKVDGRDLNEFRNNVLESEICIEEENELVLKMDMPGTEDNLGLSYCIKFDNEGVLNLKVKDSKLGAIYNISTVKSTIMKENNIYFERAYGTVSVLFKEIVCYVEESRYEFFNININIFDGKAKENLGVNRDELKYSVYNKYLKRINEDIIPNLIQDTNILISKYSDKINQRRQLNNYYESSLFMIRLASNKLLKTKIESSGDYGNRIIMKNTQKVIINDGSHSFSDINFGDVLQYENVILSAYYNKESIVKEVNIRNGEYILTFSASSAAEYVYFFENYINKEHISKEYSRHGGTYLIEKKKGNQIHGMFVKRNSTAHKQIILDLTKEGYIRSAIPSIAYEDDACLYETLIVDKYPDNFKNIYYIEAERYFIISPLINEDFDYKNNNLDNVINYLKEEGNFDKLLRWVVENSVKKDNCIEDVEKAYRLLIMEYLNKINDNLTEINVDHENIKDIEQENEAAAD